MDAVTTASMCIKFIVENPSASAFSKELALAKLEAAIVFPDNLPLSEYESIRSRYYSPEAGPAVSKSELRRYERFRVAQVAWISVKANHWMRMYQDGLSEVLPAMQRRWRDFHCSDDLRNAYIECELDEDVLPSLVIKYSPEELSRLCRDRATSIAYARDILQCLIDHRFTLGGRQERVNVNRALQIFDVGYKPWTRRSERIARSTALEAWRVYGAVSPILMGYLHTLGFENRWSFEEVGDDHRPSGEHLVTSESFRILLGIGKWANRLLVESRAFQADQLVVIPEEIEEYEGHREVLPPAVQKAFSWARS